MAVLLNYVPNNRLFDGYERRQTCILIGRWDESQEMEFSDQVWLEKMLFLLKRKNL